MTDMINFVVQTQEKLEDALGAVEAPWLIQRILEFITSNPGTVALIVASLLGLAVFSIVRSRLRALSFRQALEDREDAFPRRRWQRMGQLDVTTILTHAIDVFGRRETKEGLAAQQGALGVLYLQRGDERRAYETLTQAMTLFETTNNREGIAVYGRYLALLYREQGNFERAHAFADRSLAMYRAIGIKPDAILDSKGETLESVVHGTRVDQRDQDDEAKSP